MITVEERLELIRNSKSLREVQNAGVMPEPDSGEGYYFISYSHKDYKQVFESILGLQSENIKLWYDRGLETGKSWLKDVRKRIYSYHCKGVIFYISRDFLQSPSIWNEVDFVLRNKKSYLCVNLIGSDGISEGLNAIQDDRAKNMLHKMMGKSAMIDSTAPIAGLAKRISALKQPQLFSFSKPDSNNHVSILSIKDLTLRELKIPPLRRRKGIDCHVTELAPLCFANCIYLEKVKLPDGWETIGDYAFYNCISLTEVDLGSPAGKELDARLAIEAFEGCSSLKELTIPPHVELTKTCNVAGRLYIEKLTFLPRSHVEEYPPRPAAVYRFAGSYKFSRLPEFVGFLLSRLHKPQKFQYPPFM